jgi:Tfp pilus assembly PilM family ATPase
VNLETLREDLLEQLRSLRAGLFPRQVLLEIHDRSLIGQVLRDGRHPGPVTIDVPLPPFTCRDGRPLEKEPLGDLIGDLLVREDLIHALVMASLPLNAAHCRVVEWSSGERPQDPEAALRSLDPPLDLPFPLEEAVLDLQPLPAAVPRMLLAAAPRSLVEDWIDVFNLAGVSLDRLAPAQSCQIAALSGLLEATPSDQLLALVDAGLEERHLLLCREGVPVFQRQLPEDDALVVAEVQRSLAFYQRHDREVTAVRVLLARPFPERAELSRALGVEVEQLEPEPFGSLVLQGLATPEVETP